MSSPLADSAFAASQHPQMQRRVHRTPEAQADIAAARAEPSTSAFLRRTDDDIADLDAALSNAALADTPAVREMGGPATVASIDAMARAQNEAMQRNKATRTLLERGGHIEPAHDLGPLPRIDQVIGEPLSKPACKACECLSWEVDNGKAIILRGDEAERYRAIVAAARKAQASAITARADGAALLQLFQAFCAGLAPGKEG